MMIYWNFLGQTSSSRCEGFSDLSETNSVPIFRVCWLHATEPPAHPEDGDEVTSRNVGKTSHLDAAVFARKFHQMLSQRKLQD